MPGTMVPLTIEFSCVDNPFKLHSDAMSFHHDLLSASSQIQGSQFVLDAQQHFPKRPWKEVTERRLHLCPGALRLDKWHHFNFGILGFRQCWSNPKKLKRVLKNRTSSETNLQFSEMLSNLLTCKLIYSSK